MQVIPAKTEVPAWKVLTSTNAPAPRTGVAPTVSIRRRQVSTTNAPERLFAYFLLSSPRDLLLMRSARKIKCQDSSSPLTMSPLPNAAPPEWSVMNDPAFSRRPRCAQVNRAQHCSCDAGFHMSGTSDSSICQGEPSTTCSLVDPCLGNGLSPRLSSLGGGGLLCLVTTQQDKWDSISLRDCNAEKIPGYQILYLKSEGSVCDKQNNPLERLQAD